MRSLLSCACLVVFVAAIACSGSVSGDVAVGNTQPFVGKIWLSTDSSAPPGTFRIFLPDGTLVMDSCVETYRLAKWRALDDRRVEWHEDTARSKPRSPNNTIVSRRFPSYVRTCRSEVE